MDKVLESIRNGKKVVTTISTSCSECGKTISLTDDEIEGQFGSIWRKLDHHKKHDLFHIREVNLNKILE